MDIEIHDSRQPPMPKKDCQDTRGSRWLIKRMKLVVSIAAIFLIMISIACFVVGFTDYQLYTNKFLPVLGWSFCVIFFGVFFALICPRPSEWRRTPFDREGFIKREEEFLKIWPPCLKDFACKIRVNNPLPDSEKLTPIQKSEYQVIYNKMKEFKETSDFKYMIKSNKIVLIRSSPVGLLAAQELLFPSLKTALLMLPHEFDLWEKEHSAPKDSWWYITYECYFTRQNEENEGGRITMGKGVSQEEAQASFHYYEGKPLLELVQFGDVCEYDVAYWKLNGEQLEFVSQDG